MRLAVNNNTAESHDRVSLGRHKLKSTTGMDGVAICFTGGVGRVGDWPKIYWTWWVGNQPLRQNIHHHHTLQQHIFPGLLIQVQSL